MASIAALIHTRYRSSRADESVAGADGPASTLQSHGLGRAPVGRQIRQPGIDPTATRPNLIAVRTVTGPASVRAIADQVVAHRGTAHGAVDRLPVPVCCQSQATVLDAGLGHFSILDAYLCVARAQVGLHLYLNR